MAKILGTSIEVISNHFTLSLKSLRFYHYVVEFVPPIDAQKPWERKSALMKQQKNIEHDLGFFVTSDGSSLFSFRAPSIELEYKQADAKQIIVLRTPKECINDPLKEETQMFLNILVHRLFLKLRLLKIGRKFFILNLIQ